MSYYAGYFLSLLLFHRCQLQLSIQSVVHLWGQNLRNENEQTYCGMIRFDSDNYKIKESNPTSEEAQGSFRQLRALSCIITIDSCWFRLSPADYLLILNWFPQFLTKQKYYSLHQRCQLINNTALQLHVCVACTRDCALDNWRFWMIPGDSSESYWWTWLSNFQNQSLRFYWIKLIPHTVLKNLSRSHWFWIDYKYGKSLILPVNGPLGLTMPNNLSGRPCT